MKPEVIFLIYWLPSMIISWLMYIAMSGITVRRLRKNPKTKDLLGFEGISGLDTYNVARALSIPEAWNEKLKSTHLSFLFADSKLIKKYTSKKEQFFAKLVFYSFTINTIAMLIFLVFYIFRLLQ